MIASRIVSFIAQVTQLSLKGSPLFSQFRLHLGRFTSSLSVVSLLGYLFKSLVGILPFFGRGNGQTCCRISDGLFSNGGRHQPPNVREIQIYKCRLPKRIHSEVMCTNLPNSIKVTYSLDHNFIIRHIPGRVHQATMRNWDIAFTDALIVAPTEPGVPGCKHVGATAFDLGTRMKQPDSSVSRSGSDYRSVVLEVGSLIN